MTGTQTAYVLLGRGVVRAQGIYFSLDSLVSQMQRQFPGTTVEVKQEEVRVRGSGTRFTRHYVQVSGVKSHVPGLGEFTGTHTYDFEPVQVMDPQNWRPA